MFSAIILTAVSTLSSPALVPLTREPAKDASQIETPAPRIASSLATVPGFKVAGDEMDPQSPCPEAFKDFIARHLKSKVGYRCMPAKAIKRNLNTYQQCKDMSGMVNTLPDDDSDKDCDDESTQMS